MVRGQLTDVLKHLSLCGTNYVHHVLVVAPFLTLLQYLLKQALAILVLHQLEVVTALIAGKSQQHHPFAVVAQEWCNAVLAHVRSNGQRIYIVLLKESLGVHLRCVTDIAALGIGYNQVLGIVLLQIFDNALESSHTLNAVSLVEGQVGLVGHTVGSSSINNAGAKLKQHAEGHLFLLVLFLHNLLQAFGHLVQVCVQSHAQKALLLANLFNQFFSGHI